MTELINLARLWRRDDVVKGRPSPVPNAAGAYAWYFREVPGVIDVRGCHSVDGMPMLYVGIAPKKPYADGRRSSTSIQQRVRYHYTGNAEGSTLRLSLGCLLAGELGLELRRVGSGRRRTFSTGEQRLSEWMAANTLVCWTVSPCPWELEEALIGSFDLPLNFDQNIRNAFHAQLSAAPISEAASQRVAGPPALRRDRLA